MYKKHLIALVAVIALAGCASSGSRSQGQTSAPSASSAQGSGETAPVQIGENAQTADEAARAALQGVLKNNLVFFPFDSTEINEDGLAVIGNYAKYLSANASVKVRLEGHADERGTREYNMGLGERRANAVQSALVARGVSARQLSVVSYGEERPAVQGHDEAAWSKNRRVEIIRQ